MTAADTMETLLTAMPDAVFICDATGIRNANPAALALLGVRDLATLQVSARELCQTFQFQDAETGSALLPDALPFKLALSGQAATRILLFHRAGQGETICIRTNAAPIRHGQEIVAALVICSDITAQHQLQQALHKQARLLDLIHDAVMVCTLDNRVQFWNAGAERLFGYSAAEAAGQPLDKLLGTRFPQPSPDLVQTLLDQGYWEGELRLQGKDQQTLTVLARWVLEKDAAGLPQRILKTNTDITARKAASDALRQSEAQLRLLVEGTSDVAIILLDPEGRIIRWNPGAQQILGYDEAEIIGAPYSRLFTVEDQTLGVAVRELSEAAQYGRAEDDRWHQRKDGSRFFGTGVIDALHDDTGALQGFVKIMRDGTAQRLAAEEQRYLAHHDALTGLANRTALSERLHLAMSNADRTGQSLAVLLLDLDRFKRVNDSLGHPVGDLLLKTVAQRLSGCTRETDVVARTGGDEFVVIQTHLRDETAAAVLARKITEALDQPCHLEGVEVMTGTSIGISLYPRDARSSLELLKNADLAMYRAKEAGRNTWRFFTPEIAAAVVARKEVEKRLRQALEHQHLALHYQPQIDLASWRISGAEVLLRPRDEALAAIPVDTLIAAAEESGLIFSLGRWIIETACSQAHAWQKSGLPHFPVAVNCTPRQIAHPQFAAMVRETLETTGLMPTCLEIEITESALCERTKAHEAALSELKDMGVRLSVDDFGIGPTALGHLRQLAVDVLKIDRQVVSHLPHQRKDLAIAAAIIHLAKSLGIRVVAEGVETTEQLALLKSLECTTGQGFFFSAPLPPHELEAFLRQGKWSWMNRTDGHSC